MNTSRAKDIFLDAIDLSPHQQDEFVRDSCGDDALLRGQVEGLLHAHRANPDVLTGPAPQPQTPSPSTGHTEQPGDVIDRYRLIRVLGEGGFGSV
ncbi:MAG TPA: hypothetical protein VH518_15640, partial [Tepidisphaeraceae bacterium]